MTRASLILGSGAFLSRGLFRNILEYFIVYPTVDQQDDREGIEDIRDHAALFRHQGEWFGSLPDEPG